MVEPHVFCGPEFVLEIPCDAVASIMVTPVEGCSDEWSLQAEYLLRMQTELFNLCPAALRRRLDHSSRYPLASSTRALVYTSEPHRLSGPVPAAPNEVRYTTTRDVKGLSPEEELALTQSIKIKCTELGVSTSVPVPGHRYLLLTLTDSRLAATVYMLCLRNVCVALPNGVRLMNFYRQRAARATGVDPAAILKRRETLRAHCNLEDTLWEALEETMSPDFVDQFVASASMRQQDGGRLFTSAELHQQKVEALLRYCEEKVQYAGVFDAQEGASPFLIAIGLYKALELTPEDLFKCFVRHPRRVVRAVALFTVRHILPPEELAPFFYPSLHDSVIISCSASAEVTCSMRDLSRDLLLKDDVNEAWLPSFHAYWKEKVVEAAITAMGMHWVTQDAARQTRRQTASAAGTIAAGLTAVEEDTVDELLAASGAPPQVKGSGRGVAALGFHSIDAVMDFVKARTRTLQPQSIATLLARTQRRPCQNDGDAPPDELEEELSGSDIGAWEEGSDTDDFSIDVTVEGRPDPPQRQKRTTRSGDRTVELSQTGSGANSNPQKRARPEEVTDLHSEVLRKGYQLMLSLQGRTQPFDRRDRRYMEF